MTCIYFQCKSILAVCNQYCISFQLEIKTEVAKVGVGVEVVEEVINRDHRMEGVDPHTEGVARRTGVEGHHTGVAGTLIIVVVEVTTSEVGVEGEGDTQMTDEVSF